MGLVESILQLFFLINPLASIPVLVAAYEKGFNVRHIAINAVILAFVIAFSFIFVGRFLFMAFGISLESFRAAGGLVIILLGLDMVLRRERVGQEEVTQARAFISLIATPLLTGPATLSFLTILAIDSGLTFTLITLVVSFTLVAAVFLVLSWLIPKINVTYIEFASKIFGLFLIAFGLEMLAEGARKLIFS